MHQITDVEFELLQAAKELRKTWGYMEGKVITTRDGRDDAEAALLNVIRLAYDGPVESTS
jgi:hypothetical protein